MFCGSCGKKIKDDARFCPYCGGIVGQGSADTSATQPVSDTAQQAAVAQAEQQVAAAAQPTVPQPAQAVPVEQGNVNTQVKQARRSSRKKMPMALLIVVIAMLAAGTAFAAAYVYNTYIAPAPEVAQVEEPTEPEQTTYTTEAFTGDAYVGMPPDFKGQSTAPAFSFDLPSGWEVVSDTLDQGNLASSGVSQHRSVTVVNQDQGITLGLEIELGTSISGLTYDPSDFVSCASSSLGSGYAVGYYTGYYGDPAWFGLTSGNGNTGIVFGDMDYTVYFNLSEADSVNLAGDRYQDSSIDSFWSSFNANDPKWEEAISIMSSFRVA